MPLKRFLGTLVVNIHGTPPEGLLKEFLQRLQESEFREVIDIIILTPCSEHQFFPVSEMKEFWIPDDPLGYSPLPVDVIAKRALKLIGERRKEYERKKIDYITPYLWIITSTDEISKADYDERRLILGAYGLHRPHMSRILPIVIFCGNADKHKLSRRLVAPFIFPLKTPIREQFDKLFQDIIECIKRHSP